jgi:hypothetical protein
MWMSKQLKKIIRRILWMLYAVPITLLMLPGDFVSIYQYGPSMVVKQLPGKLFVRNT